MHSLRHAPPAEHHDADEARLKHEGHRAFEAEDIAEELAGELRKRSPVGAELKLHRNAAHDADGKIQNKQLAPEASVAIPHDLTRAHPENFDDEQKSRQTDRQNRPQDVEDGGHRELAAREL